MLQNISHIVSNINDITSSISSDPLQICICYENNEMNTTDIKCKNPSSRSTEEFILYYCFCHIILVRSKKRTATIKTVRGKEFTFSVVTVGQNKGIVPSFIRTSLDNEVQISAKQRVQPTGKKCTPVTYRLSSANNSTKLILFPDGPCRDIGISRMEISVEFLPCPDGFSLSGSECVCDYRLQKYTTNCSVNDNSIERLSNTFWMGTQ